MSSPVLFALWLVGFSGWVRGEAAEDPRGKTLEVLQELQGAIKRSFKLTMEDPDVALLEGALRGMTWALDRHTNYFSIQEAKDFMAMVKGGFGGVGMTFGMRNDRYTVISIIPGSPAEKGGLQEGDRILAINGESTLKMPQSDVVHKIRGQEGTAVTLTVLRRSPVAQSLDLPLVRGSIQIESVKHHQLGDIGYIRIDDFTQTSGGLVARAVDDLQKKEVTGLILDLRGNPGGSLDAAVQIAGIFLAQGQAVVSVEGRGPVGQTLYAPPSPVRTTLPLIILLNGGSASASEVVTGALQDYGRAVVIGTQSFGKASVQRPYPLSNQGDMMKITGQRYLTPKGRFIDGVGLTPDIIEAGEAVNTLVNDLQYRECFELCAEDYLKTGPELKEDDLQVHDRLLAQLMARGLEAGVLMDKSDVEKHREILLRTLRVELAREAFGQKAAQRQAAKEDPMVQHARDLLHVLLAVPRAVGAPEKP